MFFKTRDHIRLSYDFSGTGLVVVLLPGINENRQIWFKQLIFLKQHHFRVLTLDFRNQGESQRTYRGQRVFQLAADLRELLDYLKITKIFLVGHSMGAAVSFAYLALYGSVNLLGIIDVDQSPKMINDQTWHYGLKNLTWESFPELLKLPLPSPTWHGIEADIKEKITEVKKNNSTNSSANQALLIDNAFQDWRDVIVESKCPIYFITGAYSPYFDCNFAPAITAIAPMTDYINILNAGHLVMAEQSAVFNQALLKGLTWISDQR